MIRLSRHMEEPHRSRAQRALRRISMFRNIDWPNNPRPIIMPFLCYAEFQESFKHVLSTALRHCKTASLLTPLHWPCIKVVEAAPRTIDSFLFNWKKFSSSSCRHSPPQCTCQKMLETFPGLSKIVLNNHFAGNLHEASLPEEFAFFLPASSEDTFYTNKSQFLECANKALKNGTVLSSTTADFCSQSSWKKLGVYTCLP